LRRKPNVLILQTNSENNLQDMTAISQPTQLHNIRHIGTPTPVIPSKIALPVADGLRFVSIDGIRYLEADGNYTRLHFSEAPPLLVCRNLREIEAQLLHAPHFVRIHRSYIINVHYLERYVRGSGGYVLLEGGANLAVSSSRKQAFLDLF
jgi:two-component system LytT family response regulator